MTASESFASSTQGRHVPVPANKHKQTNGGDTGLDWKQVRGGGNLERSIRNQGTRDREGELETG